MTGKLSDFAGLFYFPFLVAAVLALAIRPRRRLHRVPLPVGRMAFAAVAVWFAAAKTIPAAHRATVWLASQIVGPVDVIRDATDVVALLALVPAWLLYRRTAATPAPVARALQAPVVCLAVLLTAATSRPRTPSVEKLIEHEGALFAVVEHDVAPDADGPWTAYTTRDGARWRATDELPGEAVAQHVAQTELVGTGLTLRGQKLFAVRRGREELAWGIPAGREEFMAAAGGHRWRMADIAALPGTSLVVVALGSEGVLVGDGQRWKRIAVGAAAPTPTRLSPDEAFALAVDVQWTTAAAAGSLAAILFSVFAWLTARRDEPTTARVRAPGPVAALRSGARAALASAASIRLDLGCAIAAAVALACAMTVFGLAGKTWRGSPLLPFVCLVPLSTAAGVTMLGWLRHASVCRGRGVRFRLRPVRLVVAAALGAGFALAALWAWNLAWVDHLRTATAFITLGVVGSALLMHRGKRNSEPAAQDASGAVGDTRVLETGDEPR